MNERDIFPLKKKFDELGLTQKDISLALGVTPQYVSKVIAGVGSTKIPDSMREFLTQLGVDVRAWSGIVNNGVTITKKALSPQNELQHKGGI